MPVIHNNEPSNEAEINAEAKALADNILDNFELPESLAKKVNEAVEKEEKGVEEVEEEKEEPVTEEAKEETPEATEEKAEEEEEQLIPKSTFQKRLDEMTREKRLLELRLKQAEEKATMAQPKDEDTVKLEKMSESELQSLKKQVRLSQLKNASDDSMVNKLFELEDKIDSVMRTAPQRFAQSQIQQFNEAVTVSSSEIQDFEKHQKDIFSLASNIYKTTPELQSSVSGQARAWNLAVEHYKLMREASVGKTKVAELDRKVNTLKKKVSLDGVSRKAVTEPDSDAKLFKKAKNGELNDTMEFIRKRLGTDAIVDGFMEART